jgi:hypothetical protein
VILTESEVPEFIYDNRRRNFLISLYSIPIFVIFLFFFFEIGLPPLSALKEPLIFLTLILALFGLLAPVYVALKQRRIEFYEDRVIIGKGSGKRILKYDSLVLGAREILPGFNLPASDKFKLAIKDEGNVSTIIIRDFRKGLSEPSMRLYDYLLSKGVEYDDELRLHRKLEKDEKIQRLKRAEFLFELMIVVSLPVIALGVYLVAHPKSSPIDNIVVILTSAGSVALIFGLIGWLALRNFKRSHGEYQADSTLESRKFALRHQYQF